MKPTLDHLVVVLPGILGSELHDERGNVVWGPGIPDLVRTGAFHPEALDVDVNPHLVPVGLLQKITAVPPTRWPGYERLVQNLSGTFDNVHVDTAGPGWTPTQHTDVLCVPYDFRIGVEHAAEHVHDRVAAQLRLQPRRRLIVIAHSLGGLVARYWLACCLDTNGLSHARVTDRLITLGTPHGGAPKALDVLANGVRLGSRRLRRLSEIALGWQSAYDLLPRYPAVSVGGRRVHPHELALLGDRATAAYAMHQAIDDGWSDLGERRPAMTAAFAREHGTLTRIDVDGDTVTVRDIADHWLPNPAWQGDGTVPADCAIPNDLPDSRDWQWLPQRHLPMVDSATIPQLVLTAMGRPTTALRGPDDGKPWLGIDLDEVYPASEPVVVTARLYGAAADARTTVRVTASPRAPGARKAKTDAERHGDEWIARLDGLRPGGYDITVRATNVPGRNDVRCDDVIGVA